MHTINLAQWRLEKHFFPHMNLFLYYASVKHWEKKVWNHNSPNPDLTVLTKGSDALPKLIHIGNIHMIYKFTSSRPHHQDSGPVSKTPPPRLYGTRPSATQVSPLSSYTVLNVVGGALGAGATGAAAAGEGAGGGTTVAAFGATLGAFATVAFGDVFLST